MTRGDRRSYSQPSRPSRQRRTSGNSGGMSQPQCVWGRTRAVIRAERHRPLLYCFWIGKQPNSTPGKKLPEPSASRQPTGPITLGNRRSFGPHSSTGTCKAPTTTPPPTSMANPTRLRCHVCGARGAVTSPPRSGRIGQGCAACQGSRGNDACRPQGADCREILRLER